MTKSCTKLTFDNDNDIITAKFHKVGKRWISKENNVKILMD